MYEMMHKKYHSAEFEVPPVKFFGITLRRGYTQTIIIDCSLGKSVHERMREGLVATMSKPNPMWEKLMESAKKQKSQQMY